MFNSLDYDPRCSAAVPASPGSKGPRRGLGNWRLGNGWSGFLGCWAAPSDLREVEMCFLVADVLPGPAAPPLQGMKCQVRSLPPFLFGERSFTQKQQNLQGYCFLFQLSKPLFRQRYREAFFMFRPISFFSHSLCLELQIRDSSSFSFFFP